MNQRHRPTPTTDLPLDKGGDQSSRSSPWRLVEDLADLKGRLVCRATRRHREFFFWGEDAKIHWYRGGTRKKRHEMVDETKQRKWRWWSYCVVLWQVMENTCGISRARSGDRECSWQGKDLVLKAQALGFIASSSTIQEILTLGCLWRLWAKMGWFFYTALYDESHEKKWYGNLSLALTGGIWPTATKTSMVMALVSLCILYDPFWSQNHHPQLH